MKCTTPKFESAKSHAEFGLSREGDKIDLSEFSMIGDKLSKTNFLELRDGFMTTYYQSANANCYFGVNFGEEMRLKLKEFRFFPKIQIALDTLVGSVVSYTLDGSIYVELAKIS